MFFKDNLLKWSDSNCIHHHLVCFESLLRKACIKNLHTVTIFFYIEKAYDTSWKYGILQELLPNFIKKILIDRKFSVWLLNHMSDEYDQETGVPQGIIIFTMFIIKINNITKSLPLNVHHFLYVDDFVICYSSSNMNIIEQKLQQTIYKLEQWADLIGFKFFEDKTKVIHFCHKRKLHPDPELYLNKHPVCHEINKIPRYSIWQQTKL